jgi:hypothetical protein
MAVERSSKLVFRARWNRYKERRDGVAGQKVCKNFDSGFKRQMLSKPLPNKDVIKSLLKCVREQ